MILTCPECATRYFVDDAKLGAEGRTVRCASCKHAWRAKAEPELELTSSAEEGAIATKIEAAKEPPASQPLHKQVRAKVAEKKSMRQAMVHGVVWGGMAVTLGLTIGAAMLFRVDIVRIMPRAAGAYAMVGMPVNPTGLVFEHVAAHPALQDGHSALVVSGSIRNVVDRAVTAPSLRISVLDKSGHPVMAKIAAADNPHLKPGEVRHFVISLIDPPATANDVEVAFAFEAKAKPKGKAEHGGHAAPAAHEAPHEPPTAQMRGSMTPEVVPEAQPLPLNSPYALPSAPAPSAAEHPGHG